VDAEPPRIVLEQPAPCADASRAEEALRRVLAPSRAPEASWTVDVRVSRVNGSLRAEGEVTDANGALVGERTVDKGGAKDAECTGLARAIGVWASLVLDDALEHARNEVAKPPPPPPALAPWPAPAPNERPSPEAQLFLKHPEDARSFELGVSTQLISGTGAGTIAGASIFAVTEAADGWFLRPSLGVGRTTQELSPQSDVYATWGAARFDACKRLPGNYLERRGIQLDLCGGGDLGFLHFDAPTPAPGSAVPPGDARTIPFVALGPSLALRGELGSELSALVRGTTELNVIRESFADASGSNVTPAWLLYRAEVGLSWRLR
jgi:hypothetical protein